MQISVDSLPKAQPTLCSRPRPAKGVIFCSSSRKTGSFLLSWTSLEPQISLDLVSMKFYCSRTWVHCDYSVYNNFLSQSCETFQRASYWRDPSEISEGLTHTYVTKNGSHLTTIWEKLNKYLSQINTLSSTTFEISNPGTNSRIYS